MTMLATMPSQLERNCANPGTSNSTAKTNRTTPAASTINKPARAKEQLNMRPE